MKAGQRKKGARRSFAFKMILWGADELTDDLENAVWEAGCDDALLGSRDEVVFLIFDREALTYRDALLSAISDVGGIGHGIELAGVEPA